MGLSRRLKSAYTICFPSGELTEEETSKAQFYLAIRSIIYKQTKGDAPDAETMNRVVETMVRNAIGITFEEKAFYDILIKVRDDHGFPYEDEKCLELSKKIKELIDDKAQYADWSTRDDIKNQLNMDLTVLLYNSGYPPEWDEEVFEKVMEQAGNFKKYN